MAIWDEEYVDRGDLREQDRVPLADFLAFKDRAQITGRGVPFFSGRETEVGAFRQAASALARGHRGNATIVVEGPPGAGKSAALSQFAEEMRSYPPAGGTRRWLPVPMDGALTMSPRAIMGAVDEAVAAHLARDLVEAKDQDAASSTDQLAALFGQRAWDNARLVAQGILDRGFSAMGFTIGGKATPPPETVLDLPALRGQHWADWQIVLLIDEAQGISANVPGAVPGTLSSIHQGLISLPLSFCAFGLPGAWDALAEVGISRGSAGYDLPLAGLDDRAAHMAVERCFAQYDVTHGGDWGAAILERSACWPQHLAVYLNAALTVLKRRAASPEAMGDARRSPLDEALALGDAGRKAYYRRRLQSLTRTNPLFQDYARDLAEALQSGARPLASELAHRIMRRHGAPIETASAFLKRAQHSGLLAIDDDDRSFAPIPSFVHHVMG